MTSSTTPRPRARGRLLIGLTAVLAILLSTLVAAPAQAAGVTVVGTITDGAGRPVAHANVLIRKNQTDGGQFIYTDANGRYDSSAWPQTSDLSTGTHWISVSVDEEHTNNGWPYRYVDTAVSLASGTNTKNFTLTELATADFTVLGPDGRRLVRAPVIFEVLRNGVWDLPQYGPNETDRNGRYRFTESTYFEKYRACFGVPSGYSGPTAVLTCWQSGSKPSEATPFTVTGGTHAKHTVRLRSGAAPSVSGTVRNGRTLTASAGAWSKAGLSVSYRWKADGRAITGATKRSFTVSNAQAGKRISVTQTAKDSEGRQWYARTSRATGKVVGTLKSSKPRIKGKAKKGRTLRAKAGSWGPGAVKLSYRWTRNGKAIKKATRAKYKVTKRDVGKKIRVSVTGRKASYTTAKRTSAKTKRVKR
ncbi:carboxypeptidase family protein [Mumia flava]|uniref:Carboxypeptidase family protein n=1 Tax=Mumia flava TaxID=1348852 RepID=A0A2M9AR75_9ACTN|nr:carboxypeptidase-like regulatory domain-containing protein [Mumia flava]PJJ48197.1 carboxypeptidase family protein [Mumia flava]